MGCPDRGREPRSEPVTVGGIFRALGGDFLAKTPLNPRQRQAFRSLALCRTPALGGAVWQCKACGHQIGVYHSCRDRHCPQCQAAARYRWVGDRLSEVLPVPYFHTVFTLPHALNDLIRINPRAMIGCLFQAVAQTLNTFAADPKHLGAEPGFLMVLHTWGRKLNFHVHIHCIITGGGLRTDHLEWTPLPHRDYLFPVKAMSPVYRGKFLDAVEKLVKKGEIFLDHLRKQPLGIHAWRQRRGRLCATAWSVYAKEPFGGPAQVIKYLGAYTHRVGISNSRLISFKNGMVSFRYKDYKHANAIRTLTLPAAEFAKRFLDHILPNGLMRIRYGGFLANCKKRKSLAICRLLLGEAGVSRGDLSPDQAEWDRKLAEAAASDTPPARECPVCRRKTLVMGEQLRLQEKQDAYRLIFDTS